MAIARDRAAVITTAVLQIVCQALKTWSHHGEVNLSTARGVIEAVVRDEIADIEREIAADRIECDPAQFSLFDDPPSVDASKSTIFDGFIKSQMKFLRSR